MEPPEESAQAGSLKDLKESKAKETPASPLHWWTCCSHPQSFKDETRKQDKEKKAQHYGIIQQVVQPLRFLDISPENGKYNARKRHHSTEVVEEGEGKIKVSIHEMDDMMENKIHQRP